MVNLVPLTTNIDKLFEIYNSGFKPPLWIKKYNLNHYYDKTICYYDHGNDINIIKNLLTFREPVNIEFHRCYNAKLLKEYFGYQISSYNINSPNIAVYCYTPVKIHSKIHNIHVLNVIGVALDDIKQPDYQRIFEKGNKEYVKMICLIFKKIKYCFIKKKFKNLVLHGFGLGNYSKYAKNLNIDPTKVFKIAFEEIFKDINPLWERHIIFNNINIKVNYPVEYKNSSLNDSILDFGDELEETLFINAWDPFSFIGNGNKKDNSLDGYFGRISAMSILGWTITNPNIKYEAVENVNIYYSKELDYTKKQFIQNPFQLIWNQDKFVILTKQLITQAKKHYKSLKLYQEVKHIPKKQQKQCELILNEFLQKPYDISDLHIPNVLLEESINWATEIKTYMNEDWKLLNIKFYLFPKRVKYVNFAPKQINKFNDLKDTPYRIDKKGKIISIPFLWHPIIYTDLNGIISNKEWFEAQIHYLKNLCSDDQQIIYNYSKNPSDIKSQFKKNRLELIIKKSPKLLNPIIVWRGIKYNYFKSFEIYDNSIHNTMDNKFTSTSIDPNVSANDFFMGKPCCLCKILLLPNTPCLFLAITSHADEREILLSRDTKFKIIDNTIKIINPLKNEKNEMIRMYTI